jgi:hypothetical protein
VLLGVCVGFGFSASGGGRALKGGVLLECRVDVRFGA